MSPLCSAEIDPCRSPTDLHRDRGRNLLAPSSVRQEMDRGRLDHLPPRRCPRKGSFLQPSRRGMQRSSESLIRSAFRRAETHWSCTAESMRWDGRCSGGVWYERKNEEETPTKEIAVTGPSALKGRAV
ncbi:unsaturated rhamnogalacturonyl hydrolase YesR [Aspergillus udagawae]|uniref:Unsaturated rhamnogalacturonyl hydrolase YesR n=1 Tax=Aspergillus udagawae TaxID=91492 RepID=A0A8H3RJP9_9EURO|nr:unsaturated rhamnogalacturonyl hydrolase YesR [Aspergillus udagawae]